MSVFYHEITYYSASNPWRTQVVDINCLHIINSAHSYKFYYWKVIEGLPGTQFKSPGFGTHSPSCCAHCSHCTNPCQWHNCGSDFFLLTYKQTQDQVYRANITASHFCKEKNSAWHRCRNRRGGWGHPPSPHPIFIRRGVSPPPPPPPPPPPFPRPCFLLL